MAMCGYEIVCMCIHVDAERDKRLLCCMYGAIKDILNGGMGTVYSKHAHACPKHFLLLVCAFIV